MGCYQLQADPRVHWRRRRQWIPTAPPHKGTAMVLWPRWHPGCGGRLRGVIGLAVALLDWPWRYWDGRGVILIQTPRPKALQHKA